MILPLLPAIAGEIGPSPSPLLYVMHWQYRALRGLRQQLKEAGISFDRYVSVFSLRTQGKLNGSGVLTEEVYVHSKVMIVDGRRVVIGSANINDRSLLGMRDSEVNVVIEDVDFIPTMLGGTPWQAGSFAYGMQTALLAQHLDCSQEDIEEGVFADPLSTEGLNAIREIARRNTEIYEDLYKVLPSDSVRTWADLSAWRAAGQSTNDITKVPDADTAERKIQEVRGRLVQYPIDFLIDDDLVPSAVTAVALKPTCWQPDAFN